jgi:hypothetical protein
MPPWAMTTASWITGKILASAAWAKGRVGAAFNPSDRTLELQEIAFAVVVGFGVSWLERTLPAHPRGLDGNWVAAFTVLAGLVTLKNIGRKAPTPGGDQ